MQRGRSFSAKEEFDDDNNDDHNSIHDNSNNDNHNILCEPSPCEPAAEAAIQPQIGGFRS